MIKTNYIAIVTMYFLRNSCVEFIVKKNALGVNVYIGYPQRWHLNERDLSCIKNARTRPRECLSQRLSVARVSVTTPLPAAFRNINCYANAAKTSRCVVLTNPVNDALMRNESLRSVSNLTRK